MSDGEVGGEPAIRYLSYFFFFSSVGMIWSCGMGFLFGVRGVLAMYDTLAIYG